MNRNVYLIAAIIGGISTAFFAAAHDLGWTLFGVVCLGCNLHNYFNNEEK